MVANSIVVKDFGIAEIKVYAELWTELQAAERSLEGWGSWRFELRGGFLHIINHRKVAV